MMHARYATRNVPRYTSYPTAPHFGVAVDGDTYAGWLAALPADVPVSLYLHVPYCRSICHYCGCHTKAARRDGPVIDFTDVLKAEIALVAGRIGRRLPVSHIHWGGGTPSLLPRDCFLGVVDSLRRQFDILPEAEHAIELDPRTVTSALAETLRQAGITRASLGVQDFDRDVQVAIGRVQPYEVVVDAAQALRAAGITTLNFDLMYGLPKQTAKTISETVDLALSLSPSRIALFGYAHVPWFKKHQRLIDEATLPGAAARLELEQVARHRIETAGMTAIGLDHFAAADDDMTIALKAGTLARNFQGYTTDRAETLIGFGPSSIGRLPQGFIQNNPDIGNWARAVAAKSLPITRGLAFSADDRLRGDIIMRLMCDYSVDVAAVAAAHGTDPAALVEDFGQLDEMVRDGLVRVDGWTVTVTPAGRPYVRIAASAFDAYLAKGQARHSVAV